MKDMLGNPLVVGDTVAIATRRGRYAAITTGIVLQRDKDDLSPAHIKVRTKAGRVVHRVPATLVKAAHE